LNRRPKVSPLIPLTRKRGDLRETERQQNWMGARSQLVVERTLSSYLKEGGTCESRSSLGGNAQVRQTT